MEIISRVPEEKVLVMLSEDELANILGHYSKYSKVSDSESFHEFLNKGIKNRLQIEVSDIYKKAEAVQRIMSSSSYDKARTKLENMLKALTPIEDKLKVVYETFGQEKME